MRALALAVSAVVLSACAGQPQQPRPNLSDPAIVKRLTVVSHDNYKKTTSYQGPNFAANTTEAVLLRATKLDDGKFVYQVYVRHSYYGQWRFYSQAHDIDGNKLELVSISREVGSCRGGCDFYEDVGITIKRDYLQQRADRGLDFKISGAGGEVEVRLNGGYVSGFLQATMVADSTRPKIE